MNVFIWAKNQCTYRICDYVNVKTCLLKNSSSLRQYYVHNQILLYRLRLTWGWNKPSVILWLALRNLLFPNRILLVCYDKKNPNDNISISLYRMYKTRFRKQIFIYNWKVLTRNEYWSFTFPYSYPFCYTCWPIWLRCCPLLFLI